MKDILFEHMIWRAHKLHEAAEYALCIMIRKGHSKTAKDEEESWFWAIYNTETEKTKWFMHFKDAEREFLKICKQLLQEPTIPEDLPW